MTRQLHEHCCTLCGVGYRQYSEDERCNCGRTHLITTIGWCSQNPIVETLTMPDQKPTCIVQVAATHFHEHRIETMGRFNDNFNLLLDYLVKNGTHHHLCEICNYPLKKAVLCHKETAPAGHCVDAWHNDYLPAKDPAYLKSSYLRTPKGMLCVKLYVAEHVLGTTLDKLDKTYSWSDAADLLKFHLHPLQASL